MNTKNFKSPKNLVLKKKKSNKTNALHTFIDSDPEDTQIKLPDFLQRQDSSSEDADSKINYNFNKNNKDHKENIEHKKETDIVSQINDKYINTKKHKSTRLQTKSILDF